MVVERKKGTASAIAEAAKTSSTVIGVILGATLILAGVAAGIAWLAGAL